MVTSIGADQFPIVIGTYVHAGTRGGRREEGRISRNKQEEGLRWENIESNAMLLMETSPCNSVLVVGKQDVAW